MLSQSKFKVGIIYLASPFFNEEQSDREIRVANKLTSLGYVVIRPRQLGIISPDASQEERDAMMKMDLDAIHRADAVFVITNDKDQGTHIEAGIAISSNIPVIYFGEGFTGKFNLMLAATGKAIFTEVDTITRELMDRAIWSEARVNTYEGEVE